jgi:hypothetical protein
MLARRDAPLAVAGIGDAASYGSADSNPFGRVAHPDRAMAVVSAAKPSGSRSRPAGRWAIFPRLIVVGVRVHEQGDGVCQL